MRLWHVDLLSLLPDARTSGDPRLNQLGGQHRECCALRGLGWGRRHATVDYVFRRPPAELAAYHLLVVRELAQRGYRVDLAWLDPAYRGARCMPWTRDELGRAAGRYPEHDAGYMQECLNNLVAKGVLLQQF